MTDADRIEALLDIVDPDRTPNAVGSEDLVVRGFARRQGRRGLELTTAGWNLLGDRGRSFDL